VTTAREPEPDVGLDVDSPTQAEVFVVWLDGDHVELTGPCGAAPWILELDRSDHPMVVVDRLAREAMGPPRLVHSTSWRRDREAVILSFVVVIDPTQVGAMETRPVRRRELARGEATEAPREVDPAQVVEHGLRHLAWLALDDPAVAAELSPAWRAVLDGYVPEPFRALG
jgi:hypothetical protein